MASSSENINNNDNYHRPRKITKFSKLDLLEAVRNENLEEIRELLKNGADVNVEDNCDTPLSAALCSSPENLEIIKELLKYGASLTKCNLNDETPLHLALKNGNGLEVIQEIIKYGADVNAKDKDGGTPIFSALSRSEENLKIVQELVKHDASFLENNTVGQTPLHIAVLTGKGWEIIQEILKYGANINAKDLSEKTPLFYALENCPENVELIKELIKCGASVNETNKFGQTSLHVAVKGKQNLEVVKEIIRHGIDVNIKDEDGNTPIYYTCSNFNEDFDVLMELLKHGASVKGKNYSNETPLLLALRSEKSLEFIKELLKHDADVNTEDVYGNTPLSTVINTDYIDCEFLENLFNYGASVHQCIGFDKFYDILYEAEEYGVVEVIKYLLIEHPDSIDCSFCKQINDTFADYYVSDLKKEIDDMKNDYIVAKMSLYDIIVNKYDYGKLFLKQNDVLSKFNNYLGQLPNKYPLYHELILDRLESRTYLLRHLYDLRIFIKINEKVFDINSCCLRIIGKYLSKEDLKKFISAFSSQEDGIK